MDREEWRIFANTQLLAVEEVHHLHGTSFLNHHLTMFGPSYKLRSTQCWAAEPERPALPTAHDEQVPVLLDAAAQASQLATSPLRPKGKVADEATAQRVAELHALHLDKVERLAEQRLEAESRREEDELEEIRRLQDWRANNSVLGKSSRLGKSPASTKDRRPPEIRLLEWGDAQRAKQREALRRTVAKAKEEASSLAPAAGSNEVLRPATSSL